MTLLNTFCPKDDESGLGYYRRLAACNYLWGWRELTLFANVPAKRIVLQANIKQMVKELGLDEEWAAFASRQEQQRENWGIWKRSRIDAICPSCLSEDIYLRHYWEHSYVTTCSIHQCELIDHCPACSQPLSCERRYIEQCICGYDLRNGKPTAATASQNWLSALIATDGYSSGKWHPKLHRVDVKLLCEVMRTLCVGGGSLKPVLKKRVPAVRTVSEASDFLRPLEQLLDHWPQGFEQHVADRISAGKSEGRTLNTLLGQWYTQLRRVSQGNPLEVFLEVIIAVAADKFDGSLGLDTTRSFASDITGHLRLSDAAKKIGASRDLLVNAIRNGDCAYRTRRFGTRGLVYEISQAEINRIIESRTEWVSEANACKLAHVSAAVLRHMMDAEIIDSDAHWKASIFKSGPIRSSSLKSLYQKFSETQEKRKHDINQCIFFDELTTRRMGDKRAIINLMRAISSGEIPAVACGPHLGSVGFLLTDVSIYFGTPVLESGMSVQQLAKVSGWKWESVSHWISLGLLQSEQILLRGQPCRVITPQQLHNFQKTYIPLSDLAKTMDTKASSLAKRLTGVEVIGAKPLPNGLKRGGLIRLADLGRLASAGAQIALPFR